VLEGEPSLSDEFILLDEVAEPDSTDLEVSRRGGIFSADLPQVYDNHFHLDRTSKWIWDRETGHTVEDLLAYSLSKSVDYKPYVKVDVVGGIIMYSEPKNYPKPQFDLQGPWRVAVGVHPKRFDTLTTKRLTALNQLLRHPKVVALGECGLERTIPANHWPRQDEVFKKIIKIAKADRPIILHLRGPIGDVYGTDVSSRCRDIMRKFCSWAQRIHVHCFKGTVEMVEDWLSDFPNAYFGVTAAVQSFDPAEIAGLKAIPRDRLLLETDSPYLPPGRAAVNTPAYLRDVAAYVMSYLDHRPEELYRLTLENARTIYGV
jgi:TatD DNase family protein